jgi:hypothetical protein
VPRLAVATRYATYCLQMDPIGDLPLYNENTRDVIGRQPWLSVHSNTRCGIDIILSLNIQQKCTHSLIVVEKSGFPQRNCLWIFLCSALLFLNFSFYIVFVEEVLNLVPIRLVVLEMYAVSFFFSFTIRLRLIGAKMHQLKFFF